MVEPITLEQVGGTRSRGTRLRMRTELQDAGYPHAPRVLFHGRGAEAELRLSQFLVWARCCWLRREHFWYYTTQKGVVVCGKATFDQLPSLPFNLSSGVTYSLALLKGDDINRLLSGDSVPGFAASRGDFPKTFSRHRYRTYIAKEYTRLKSLYFVPPQGAPISIVTELCVAKYDDEYNALIGQPQGKVALHWAPPPDATCYRLPYDVPITMVHHFKIILNQWWNSPARQERGFRAVPVGPRVNWDHPLLDSIHKRNELLPSQVLAMAGGYYPSCTPFPKAGYVTSSGSLRTVYSCDYSYEAFLRDRVTRKQAVHSFSGYFHLAKRADLASIPDKYRHVYDIINCDYLTGYLLRQAATPEQLQALYPLSVLSDGTVYRSAQFPSGTLVTSEMCALTVSAVLKHLRVKKAYVGGDSFATKKEFSNSQYPYLRRGDDYSINGFGFREGCTPRYLRVGEKFSRPAYLKSYRHLNGTLLYIVRYKAYERMLGDMTLAPISMEALRHYQVSMPDSDPIFPARMTLEQLCQFMSVHRYPFPGCVNKAMDMQVPRLADATEGYYTQIAPAVWKDAIIHKVPL